MMKRQMRSSRDEAGVALITVVMMTSLVIGLVALALTNGMVGRVVTNTYVAQELTAECGQGNLDVAEGFLEAMVEEGQQGVQDVAKETDVKILETSLLNEIHGGIGTASSTPIEMGEIVETDITIAPQQNTGCRASVDFEHLYTRERPGGGSEEVYDVGYHDGIQGVACDDGNIYSVATQVNNLENNAATLFRSVYYDCPS